MALKRLISSKKTFSLENLAQEISKLEFDNEIIKLHDFEFEFEDKVVDIVGFVHGYYSYCEGDYWTPPIYSLDSWGINIEGVKVDDEDMNNKDICKLESLIDFL